MKLHTATEVATQLGKNHSTITRMAQRLKVGSMVGRMRVFTDDDVQAMRLHLREPGNPNFVAGNYMGQPLKKKAAKKKKS